MFLPPDATEGLDTLPAWSGIVFNLIGVVFNIAFGALGGFIGGSIFNSDKKQAKTEPADDIM